MQHTAYIALGSNIEPKTAYLQQAIDALNHHPSISVDQQSSVYQTAPVGYADQDDFFNMAIEVSTSLPAPDLLQACQAIEQDLKRVRIIKNGPRTIDLDILLYDDLQIQTDQLTVPHPRMHHRAFVLLPLADLASQKEISGSGKSVGQWKEILPQADMADIKNLGPLDSIA